MGQIRFKARLIAPHFINAPPEEVEKWAKRTKESALKAYQALKKVIKTKKDFDQKIGKPTEKTIDSFIPPTYRTKHGLTKKDIMNKTRDSLERAAKRYFLKREETYKTPKYEEKVEFGKKRYAENWVKKQGPLWGYKKSGIKGLGALVAMALSADEDLVKFLKPDRDDISEGNPVCVALPDKVGKFRNDLRNLIVRYGSFIIDGDYYSETIRLATERLNQLVEQYRTLEFAPFTPQGASHIDFIVVEIPIHGEPFLHQGKPIQGEPDPNNPDKMIKQLGLEIQVSPVRNP